MLRQTNSVKFANLRAVSKSWRGTFKHLSYASGRTHRNVAPYFRKVQCFRTLEEITELSTHIFGGTLASSGKLGQHLAKNFRFAFNWCTTRTQTNNFVHFGENGGGASAGYCRWVCRWVCWGICWLLCWWLWQWLCKWLYQVTLNYRPDSIERRSSLDSIYTTRERNWLTSAWQFGMLGVILMLHDASRRTIANRRKQVWIVLVDWWNHRLAIIPTALIRC